MRLPAHQLFHHKPIQLRLKNSFSNQNIASWLAVLLANSTPQPATTKSVASASPNLVPLNFKLHRLRPASNKAAQLQQSPHTHQNHPCTPKPNHTPSLGNNTGTNTGGFPVTGVTGTGTVLGSATLRHTMYLPYP